MWTAWDIPGMLSPCWDAVGDISAPVAQNRIFFISPLFTLCIQSKKQDSALKTHRALFHFFVYVL